MSVPVALLIVAIAPGCVIPTASLHSFRDVTVTLTEAESAKPVARVPFRVEYDCAAADSPFVYQLELRTPKAVQATTGADGKAVIKLADYAWRTQLTVDERSRGYGARFLLTKELVRNGGIIESPPYRPLNYPGIRLQIQPSKRPNKQD